MCAFFPLAFWAGYAGEPDLDVWRRVGIGIMAGVIGGMVISIIALLTVGNLLSEITEALLRRRGSPKKAAAWRRFIKASGGFGE